MFYGIIGALLTSVGDLAYKKSVIVSKSKLSNSGYQFVSGFFYVLLISFFYFISIIFDFQSITNILILKIISIFFIIGSINVFGGLLSSFAYKNEKISVLTIYQQFETIFTVIFGFIFFSGISYISFIFVFIAGITLLLGSFDKQNLKFNKYAFAIMLSSIIYSVKSNLLAFLLISITPLDSILYSNLFTFICALLLVYFKNESKKSINKTDKKMVVYMIFESFSRILIGIIYAYLISEIGIVQTSLLSLLSILTNLVFGYIFFKEIPTKKEYLITFVVISCVILGNLF
ncbi:MAG: EamA family transporter [Candidatus Gracilibacteria bacterium]|nr:EamA family transporter [Candidatus Gracilibacteria bacterium]